MEQAAKGRWGRTVLAGLIYLLLVALAGAAYLAGSDPAGWDKRSPFSSAGPATLALSRALAGVMGGAAPWPDWVTPRDRESMDRLLKTVREGESKKFITALMAFQDELEERGKGVLELKGAVISSLAGEVIANSLTPLAFGFLALLSLFWMSGILSRAGANPMDALWKALAYLVGVAGSFFLRFLLAGALFIIFTGAGLYMRSFPNLLFGAAEGAAWLTVVLLAVWIATLTGMANAPRPSMEKCPACKGLGYIPGKSSQRENPAPSVIIGDEDPGRTVVIKPD